MWSWLPATVTPDGGRISAGTTFTQDCLGSSSSIGYVTPSLILQATASNYNTSSGTAEIDGYGLRECVGVSTSSGLCDVGNGITVVKGGVEYRNTNILDFSGNLTLSSNYGKALINILAGSGEASVPYATRIDFVNSTTMYKGEAAVGTTDADSVWRISKYAFAGDGDVGITWASGNDNFDKVWNNRASLSYS